MPKHRRDPGTSQATDLGLQRVVRAGKILPAMGEGPRELVIVQLFELPSPMAHTAQILATACALSARGIRTHVYFQSRDARAPLDVLRDDHGLEPSGDLVLHPLPGHKGLAGLRYRASLLERLVRGGPGLVFYGRHRRHTLQLLGMRRLTRVAHPVLFEFHNLEHVLARERGDPRADEIRAEEAELVRRCDGLAAISRPLLDDLVERFHPRVPPALIPDGVDLARFRGIRARDLEGEEIRLVYAGSLYAHKGVESLLDALERLGPRFRLELIGGHPAAELERLRERVRATPALATRVTFTETVRALDVPAGLARADLVLLPASEESRSRRYTSPLKLFEAMASSVPIVAAPAPALTSVLSDGETAFVAATPDGAGIARAVERALAVPARALEIGRAASRAAEEYGWDRRAERILELCAAVLE